MCAAALLAQMDLVDHFNTLGFDSESVACQKTTELPCRRHALLSRSLKTPEGVQAGERRHGL